MYYTLILWFEKIKTKYDGYMEIVNYADDMVICFQYWKNAKDIYELLVKRLEKCGLEFAKDKTRLIQFGRFAEETVKRENNHKPYTFDFLGFTHYCTKSGKTGRFRVKRKNIEKEI